MATKKTPKVKPLTKLQLAERKAQNMEWAIISAYNNFDELFALLRIFRDYTQTEQFDKYTSRNALNGIFTLAINIQTSMMDEAGIEY